MLRYLARRAANALVLALAATCLGYVLASVALDPLVRFRGNNPPVPDEQIRHALAITGTDPNTPLASRLWSWLSGLAHGSLGTSVDNRPVTSEIAERAGTSLQLLVLGTVLGVGLGVLVGVVGAVRQHRWFDRVTTQGSFVVLATPTFVVAVLLMVGATRLNEAAGRQVIRFTGQYTPGHEGWAAVTDRASHLVLPTLALVIGLVAAFSRYQRAAMLDVLGTDLVRGARAMGHTQRSALVRHGVRVAMVPMSTLAVYTAGMVLAGATITELAFSWHGMGEYLLLAAQRGDVNAAAGTVACTAVLVLVLGMVADVLYAWLDPRVRL
ncbi:MAG: ABC transporter permease [Micrococcales bacterium]|nr:ABC transporter permease [Micrococcales bacterium]MCL2668495.1 ABC transporter permease [Micrococcales bacterium]